MYKKMREKNIDICIRNYNDPNTLPYIHTYVVLLSSIASVKHNNTKEVTTHERSTIILQLVCVSQKVDREVFPFL